MLVETKQDWLLLLDIVSQCPAAKVLQVKSQLGTHSFEADTLHVNVDRRNVNTTNPKKRIFLSPDETGSVRTACQNAM